MNPGLLKGLGIIATAIGFGATIFSNWVEDKNLDRKIEDRVNKALEERENEEES